MFGWLSMLIQMCVHSPEGIRWLMHSGAACRCLVSEMECLRAESGSESGYYARNFRISCVSCVRGRFVSTHHRWACKKPLMALPLWKMRKFSILGPFFRSSHRDLDSLKICEPAHVHITWALCTCVIRLSEGLFGMVLGGQAKVWRVHVHF